MECFRASLPPSYGDGEWLAEVELDGGGCVDRGEGEADDTVEPVWGMVRLVWDPCWPRGEGCDRGT